jgi:uncharacterized protein YdhG (YjbR/CyaY superfamily)
MTKRSPTPAPAAVTAYISAAPEPARSRLRALRKVIREEAPGAIERMAYGLATWHQGENLIHLGAFRHHVGVYPGPAAITAFEAQLARFKTSKGALQLPHDAPLPVDLVRHITRWRVAQVAGKPPGTGAARPSVPGVAGYNAAQAPPGRATCLALASLISTVLPDAEGKVWHGHPVWFLEGNPVVGYSTHKDGTRLLFWSGQSFGDPGLSPVGKFKAAEARLARVEALDGKAVRRWLAQARDLQWDYKNLAKNKGVLRKLG